MTAFNATARPKKNHFGLVGEFALACLGGVLLALSVASLFEDHAGVAGALLPFGLGMGLVAMGLRYRYPHDELGLCNLITIARLAMISGLTPLLWRVPGDDLLWIAFGIAALSLLLDGVDGWAARRAGLESDFGARFDMEVDAAFALLLSILAYNFGQVGLWVLALGLPHYIFVIAAMRWRWLAGDMPDLFSRKAVCVLQIGVLMAFLVPIIPQLPLLIASSIAAVALAGSFARDIIYLHARRTS